LTGSEHDRGRLLADVLGRLERAHREYFSAGFAGLVERYTAKLSLQGKRVAFRRAGRDVTGDVAGVRGDGGLSVRTPDGRTLTLYDEEITVR
jgi:biotin-(acetyl-CoA carboxylase) ligase